MEVTIRYDDRDVVGALNRLLRAGADLTPAMRSIAGVLEEGAEEAFQSQQAPDGTPWASLSEHTKNRRAKKGKWPGQILQVTGDLAGGITSAYDASSAVAGTNLVYAPTHQFGAEEGDFGSTGRGRPIPFGDIPARPFLGVSHEAELDILDAINRHFSDALVR